MGTQLTLIDLQDAKTQYQSFNCALHLVAQTGQGAFMSKGDVKSAFRIVPIGKEDCSLLGIKIQHNYFMDICLPFGASISCAIFKQIGTLLQWLAKQKAGYDIVCYLDDFFTAHQVQFICDQIMSAVHQSCEEVGVPMAPEKRVWATQIIEFLGLTLDTLLMIVHIPQDKINDIRSHLAALKSATEVHAKSLKWLAGKVNFITKAFPMGRPFIRHIYDQAAGVPNNQQVPITEEVLADINMWFQFLKSCKGWLPILDNQQCTKQTISVFTNASANPNLGWGVYMPIMG